MYSRIPPVPKKKPKNITLRDKISGRFKGSIGTGKTHTPQPKPVTPAQTSKLSDEENQTLIALIDHRALSRNVLDRSDAARAKPINRTIAEHLLNDHPPEVAIALARNPTLDLDLLLKLSKHQKQNVATAAIFTGRLSSKQLNQLADSSNDEICGAVAIQTTDPQTLDKLSSQNSVYTQFHVSQNLNTSPETLTKLSTSPDHGVQRNVAENKQTPTLILEKLSTHENEMVRAAVALNINTETNMAETLFAGLNKTHQIMLIQFDRLTAKFLADLVTNHPTKKIRQEAHLRLR